MIKMNISIVIGIIFIAVGTYLIQKGRTELAFKNTKNVTDYINEIETVTRLEILKGIDLSSDEVVEIVNSQTKESAREIKSALNKGFVDMQKSTTSISDILTGGNTYPSFRLIYRPNTNQLQFNLYETGKNKLPNKLIQIYNLSPNRDREMLKVSKPALQYLIEQTNEYLEFYIEGSTTGKLSSWLFEVITQKEDFVYLLIRTQSDNGITRQIYYVDNFRENNFFMDYFKHIDGISGMFEGKVLETHSDKGIKLYDNGMPIPDNFIIPFGELSMKLNRDWENRKDVHIPDGWSQKKK